MKTRDLAIFLGLEFFAIFWAGAMFSLIPAKIVAGLLAGGYFVISGIFMLGRANRWPRKWQSPTWYLLFIHVFVISVPMLMSRMVQMSAFFEDVKIMGLSGPQFHQLSTIIFSALIGATILDWWRSRRTRKNPSPE